MVYGNLNIFFKNNHSIEPISECVLTNEFENFTSQPQSPNTLFATKNAPKKQQILNGALPGHLTQQFTNPYGYPEDMCNNDPYIDPNVRQNRRQVLESINSLRADDEENEAQGQVQLKSPKIKKSHKGSSSRSSSKPGLDQLAHGQLNGKHQQENIYKNVNNSDDNNYNNNRDYGKSNKESVSKCQKASLNTIGTDHSSCVSDKSNERKQKTNELKSSCSAKINSEGYDAARGPPPPPQFDRIAGEKYEKYVKIITYKLKNFEISDKF